VDFPSWVNENQREWLAKVADNLATSSMVAAIAGGIVDHKIGLAATCALFVMFLVLLFIAFNLRKEESKNVD
jgi:hypothetical protein